MKPMIEPKRDLAGATPETLARALLRSGARVRGKPVVRDEVVIEKVPADKTGDGVAHLVDGV